MSAFYKLPHEIIVEIAKHLSTTDIFRLRDVIAEFNSRLVLYEAILNIETHPPSTSARRPLKELELSDKELDEREALYLQHEKGWPIRRVSDIDTATDDSGLRNYSIYSQVCQNSVLAYLLPTGFDDDSTYVVFHNLVNQETASIRSSGALIHVAISEKIAIFSSFVELFILDRKHLKGHMNLDQLIRDSLARRELLKDHPSSEDFRIMQIACHGDNIAAVTQGHQDLADYIHVIGEQVTSFMVPNCYDYQNFNSGHGLVFDREYLWHVYAVEKVQDNVQQLIVFQCFTLDGELYKQWQHGLGTVFIHVRNQWMLKVTSTGKDWLVTIPPPYNGNAHDGINFIADLYNQKIERFSNGNLRLWKDIVYTFGDHAEAARLVDTEIQEPFLELGHDVGDIIVNDSYYIVFQRYKGRPYWSAYTFDEALAPDGMKMIAVYDEVKEGYATFEEEWRYKEWLEEEEKKKSLT